MDKYEIISQVDKTRKILGLADEPVDQDTLIKRLENNNFYLFYEELERESISGTAFKKNNLNFIVINSSQTIGRQNFTLGHEVGHIILHQKQIFDMEDESKKIEKEADTFAANFLMPETGVKKFIGNRKKISKFDILMVSQNFRVSYKAALYRLLGLYSKRKLPDNYDKINVNEVINEYKYNQQYEDIEKKAKKIAEDFKIDTSLYKPNEKAYYPDKKILYKVINKYKNIDISFGKLLEFLKFLNINPDKIMDDIK